MVCKESVVQEMTRVEFDEQLKNSTVVLIDVAGTTTALSFIKETLYPFVIGNVRKYLSENWENATIIDILNKLREECDDLPKDGDKDTQLEKFVEYIINKTQENSESNAIKSIQGYVYEDGYTKGQLKGHVFEDVALALQSWSEECKRRVCVYSSGTIESQKLLFGWSCAGDLTTHINTHFDQTIGAKTDATSYKNIAQQLDCKPEAIVFLTDSIEEGKAASQAGVNVVLVSREGNAPIADEHKKLFPIVHSFKELPLNKINVDADVTAKRKLSSQIDDDGAVVGGAAADDVNIEPPSKIAKTENVDDKRITKDIENTNEKTENIIESKDKTTIDTLKHAPVNIVIDSNSNTNDNNINSTIGGGGGGEAMEGVECDEESSLSNETKNVENQVVNDDTSTLSKEIKSDAERMEIEEETSSHVTENINTTATTTTTTDVSTVALEKKSTESKGTQVALKVSNNDVASQAEIDVIQNETDIATTVVDEDHKLEDKKCLNIKKTENNVVDNLNITNNVNENDVVDKHADADVADTNTTNVQIINCNTTTTTTSTSTSNNVDDAILNTNDSTTTTHDDDGDVKQLDEQTPIETDDVKEKKKKVDEEEKVVEEEKEKEKNDVKTAVLHETITKDETETKQCSTINDNAQPIDETKQTDDNVPDNKENGSIVNTTKSQNDVTDTTTTTTLPLPQPHEKTDEQKTENIDSTTITIKSNGANGVEEENNKKTVMNDEEESHGGGSGGGGEDKEADNNADVAAAAAAASLTTTTNDAEQMKNGVATATTTTNGGGGDTTNIGDITEIKVKTVSDIVGSEQQQQSSPKSSVATASATATSASGGGGDEISITKE